MNEINDHAAFIDHMQKINERQFREVTRAMALLNQPLTAHKAKALWNAYELEDPQADSVKG